MTMRPKQSNPITIYLGSGAMREQNIAVLKRLASKFAGKSGRSKDGNISGFIKNIIDGKLIVIDPDEYRRQETNSPTSS